MNQKYFFYLGIGLFIVIIFALGFSVNAGTAIARLAPPPPTAAPPPTPGAPPTSIPSAAPALAQPLTNDRALERALDYDTRWAERAQPLSLSALKSAPNSFTVNWYADRNYDGSDYGPEAERGPVWVINIKGPVVLHLLGRGGQGMYDGVTYVIAQRTGNLLAITSGQPVSK